MLREIRICLDTSTRSLRFLLENPFCDIYFSVRRMNWQEPCIVFSPSWSLRLGPAVHLLQRWCQDENSLLVLEVLIYPLNSVKFFQFSCAIIYNHNSWDNLTNTKVGTAQYDCTQNEIDAELALLPFKPVTMKVLQCSFLSGIKYRSSHLDTYLLLLLLFSSFFARITPFDW